MGHIDLRLGEIVYKSVFCNISFSWLLPQDGFNFIFLCRVYSVTVKTIYSRDICFASLFPYPVVRNACTDSITARLIKKSRKVNMLLLDPYGFLSISDGVGSYLHIT